MFWPLVALIAFLDGMAILTMHWNDGWLPALTLSPLVFFQVWIFSKVAGQLAGRSGNDC
jgi:hypothetical protein